MNDEHTRSTDASSLAPTHLDSPHSSEERDDIRSPRYDIAALGIAAAAAQLRARRSAPPSQAQRESSRPFEAREKPRARQNACQVVAIVSDEHAAVAALRAGANAVRLAVPAPPPGSPVPRLPAEELLPALVGHAHALGAEFGVTLDWTAPPSSLRRVAPLLWQLRMAGVDAMELADLGLARLVQEWLPHVRVHGTTRIGANSRAAVAALADVGFERVTLSPELRCAEMVSITRRTPIEIEAALYGANWGMDGAGIPPLCRLPSAQPGASHADACRATLSSRATALDWRDARTLADAGVAALRLDLREAELDTVRGAVSGIRLALDSSKPDVDELGREVDALLAPALRSARRRANTEPRRRPPKLDPGPRGAPVTVECSVRKGALRVAVRDGRHHLAHSMLPLERLAEADIPADAPPQWRMQRFVPPVEFSLRLRGLDAPDLPPDAKVPELERQLTQLWTAVKAQLEEDSVLFTRHVKDGQSRTPHTTAGALSGVVEIGVPTLPDAAQILTDSPTSRARVPLHAVDGPEADQAALAPPLRARTWVDLPLATFEDDRPDLQRRLERMAVAGFGGLVAHDPGQLRLAHAAGFHVHAGDGLTAANEEAATALEGMGATSFDLSLDVRSAEWLALAERGAPLPFHAPLFGWWPHAATRGHVEAAGGALDVSGEIPLRRHFVPGAGGGITAFVPEEPFSRLAEREALSQAGASTFFADGILAPPSERSDRAVPQTLLTLVRPAVGATPSGLHGESDREVERKLGGLYGAVDRLTQAFRRKHGLACSPSCASCCAQFVPVWPVEAAALIPGIRQLAPTEEERQALREAAEAQLAEQTAALAKLGVRRHPSELAVWRIQPGQLDTLIGQDCSPCVLLTGGRCQVYARRPLLCRIYGYPTAAIPGNLCRRLSGRLLQRSAGRRMPSIPARHVLQMGESIRKLQGLPEGVTDVTTVAAIVAHALR